jgi:uncharacterized membrane protein
MNGAHFHLAFNHLPIIFPIVGLIVLAGGFIFKSEVIKRVAFFIFIFGALFTIPAFGSGEGAEEVIENLPGIDKKFILAHEEKAELFAILSYLLGAFSLFALWANWKKKAFSNIIAIVLFVFAIVSIYFAKVTGTSGGEIRHTEIRSDFSKVNSSEAGETKNLEGEDE